MVRRPCLLFGGKYKQGINTSVFQPIKGNLKILNSKDNISIALPKCFIFVVEIHLIYTELLIFNCCTGGGFVVVFVSCYASIILPSPPSSSCTTYFYCGGQD